MDGWIKELQLAVRVFLRRPLYTSAALLALGLGIGANTAIFSVFDAVLLTPLEYREPERLVRIWEKNEERGIEESRVSPVVFDDLRQQADSFSQLAGWWHPDLNLTSEDAEPLRIEAINATDRFFEVLGVSPQQGRTFAEGEDQPGGPRIAVISHRLWQSRYGGSEDILDQSVHLDGRAFDIVGVMPAGFHFPEQTDIWLPLGWDPANHSRGARFFGVVGRLTPGVEVATARAEVEELAGIYAADFPRTNEGWGMELLAIKDDLVREIRPALWLLFGAVALVLLIACANVANLLLAQAATRRQEMAVRTAVGASSGQVLRQLLLESLLLGLGGGVLGLAVGWMGLRFLLTLAPSEIPQLLTVGLDGRVLLFTFSAAILASLIFGLAPAWQVSRFEVRGALSEGSRAGTDPPGSRYLRALLVVGEVALAVVLLFGAGLLVRSFQQLLAEDSGFAADRTLTFNLQLPRASYADWPAVNTFYDRLRDRLRQVPEIQAVGVAGFLPFEAGWRADFQIDGVAGLSDREQPEGQYRPVSPGYFQAAGISLLQGRDFDDRDASDRRIALILNQAAVERYFPDQDPIGEVIVAGTRAFGPLGRFQTETLDCKIVGIVADVKNTEIEKQAEPALYFSYRQLAYRAMNIVVRSSQPVEGLSESVKAAVWDLDSDLPVADLRTLADHLGASVARRRFVMLLLSVFAGLSLLLASIGTYGVMALTAGRRRREIGIRMALGAGKGKVIGMMVRQGLGLSLAGVALGVIAALAGRRVMGSLVYGVGTADIRAFGGAIAILALAAFLACYLPARRAARVDPMEALRED